MRIEKDFDLTTFNSYRVKATCKRAFFPSTEEDFVDIFSNFKGVPKIILGGGYNIRDNGISFEGIPEDLKIKEGRKGSYKISFRINDKNKESESYNVFIKLFPNHRSNISINTSHRTGINYNGAISESITKESNQ